MALWFVIFGCFAVLFGVAALIWWRVLQDKQQKQMLEAIRVGFARPEGTAKTVVMTEAPKADRSRLRLVGMTAIAALAGMLIGLRFEDLFGLAAPLLGAAAIAVLPALYVSKKRSKRLAAIEEQFPEALDCLSRSIRAGNAFSVAIEFLGAETNEPLKSEIQKFTRELALGSSLEDGLNGLIARVPLLEIRFFASAVLLQRETGGNLAEVIAKLSSSLRERFRLKGQVKAASGQGRLTAMVLTALPVAVLGFLRVSSPDYLNNLTGDVLGRNLLAAAAVLQVTGFLVMRKIIRIEV
jgi:tight adherence protein B